VTACGTAKMVELMLLYLTGWDAMRDILTWKKFTVEKLCNFNGERL